MYTQLFSNLPFAAPSVVECRISLTYKPTECAELACAEQIYEECEGPALILQFLASCSDSKLLETGLHHMHRACSASALLCTTWAGQGSMELALAVAADTTWPAGVRRSALLLVSVLCRGSSEAAQHFLQLEVSRNVLLDRSVASFCTPDLLRLLKGGANKELNKRRSCITVKTYSGEVIGTFMLELSQPGLPLLTT